MIRKLGLLAPVIIISLLLSINVHAGPFGTHMGQPVSAFKDLTRLEGASDFLVEYRTQWMPRKNSTFSDYDLFFWEGGLAKITAIGRPREDSGNARASLEKYELLRAQLEREYGQPFKVIEPGNTENDPGLRGEKFGVSLHIGSGAHACIWRGNLPDDLCEIALYVEALSGTSSNVVVVYIYSNMLEVEKKFQHPDADAM